MAERKRGAVRNEVAHQAILRAAAAIVETTGFESMSIEGIASEAGVAKQTIYRWYDSKSAIIAEALIEGYLVPTMLEIADTGDLHADLVEWLTLVFDYMTDPKTAALVGSLLSAAVQQPEISEQLGERMGASAPTMMARFEAARAAGQLRAGVTPDLLSETIYGVIVIRILGESGFTTVDAVALADMLLGPAGIL